MTMVQDFLRDPVTGDLMIKDGDFVIGNSDDQHIEDIILAFKGEFKNNPTIGVGIKFYQNAPYNSQSERGVIHAIRRNLALDGYKKITIVGRGNSLLNIDVDATR